jgi:hypothetical protein
MKFKHKIKYYYSQDNLLPYLSTLLHINTEYQAKKIIP